MINPEKLPKTVLDKQSFVIDPETGVDMDFKDGFFILSFI